MPDTILSKVMSGSDVTMPLHSAELIIPASNLETSDSALRMRFGSEA